MKLKKTELQSIYGGGTFSASMVSAIVKGFQFIYDLGRIVGTSISRAISKNFCS